MGKMEKKTIKLCLVCTAGGHFEQMSNLSNFYKKYNYYWITNKNKQTESALINDKKYYINPAHYKKPWDYFGHIKKVYNIFQDEKPTHVISTGSGRTAFIPYLMTKLLRINFIYIETYSRVNNLTLNAKLVSLMGDTVHTQWQSNKKNTKYIGPVFQDFISQNDDPKKVEPYVFVSLGTRKDPFCRLVKSIEQLKVDGILKEKIIIQAGWTDYESKHMEVFDFCSVDDIENYIKNASYIITQESAGIGNKCLKYGKKFLVMPRDYAFGELPSKYDMEEDLQYRLEELGYTRVVRNIEELTEGVKNINRLKTGFKFDNTKAISKLNEIVNT
jgi:UDP-N-acetylglucosamine transferase subunit ALG13